MAQWNPFEGWRLFDKKLIGLLRALARGKVHCVKSPSFLEEAQDDIR